MGTIKGLKIMGTTNAPGQLVYRGDVVGESEGQPALGDQWEGELLRRERGKREVGGVAGGGRRRGSPPSCLRRKILFKKRKREKRREKRCRGSIIINLHSILNSQFHDDP